MSTDLVSGTAPKIQSDGPSGPKSAVFAAGSNVPEITSSAREFAGKTAEVQGQYSESLQEERRQVEETIAKKLE
ncbi:hypothetical protein MNV49_006818 [Pseudohyphozyma bogoriensis]|nr:hypothetical protein MNV49_006818 [Pseudohyphozyma bogoriensis]